MTQMKPNSEFSKEKNKVKFEKKVNPDGSYVEFITDYQNKRAEIREYDTQGNCVNSAYFRLS